MTPSVITVADFGLTRREPMRPRRMNSFCGTTEFLAPEMIKMNSASNCREYGKEIDIWAIGIMSYVVMSGEFPFFDESDSQIMSRIVQDGVVFENGWTRKSQLCTCSLDL